MPYKRVNVKCIKDLYRGLLTLKRTFTFKIQSLVSVGPVLRPLSNDGLVWFTSK